MAGFTDRKIFVSCRFGGILVGIFVGIIATVAADENQVAHESDQRRIEIHVERYLDRLDDDSHATRKRAITGLLRLAHDSQPQQNHAIIQTMLRRSLFADLETQLAIDRLVGDITLDIHHQNVERVVTAIEVETQATEPSPLMSTWQTFSSRAGTGEEARQAFREIAVYAGPQLSWPPLNARVDSDDADLVLISHLGCVAPQLPQPFRPQSERVLAVMKRTLLAAGVSSGSDANARVIGRLIDRTILENPYGWTLPERLHMALLYDRTRVVSTLRWEVLRCEDPLARDLAAAILVTPRCTKSWIGEIEEEVQRLVAALEDRRVVCVAPEQLVARPHPIVLNQQIHRRGVDVGGDVSEKSNFPVILRTRVQDVAAWALVQGTDFDTRDHGLTGLQADPVWGTRLASIGFATEWERTAFLESVRRYQEPGAN